eukprot:TRINITY_DN6678_c0_g1_i2.p1 TRINITY_DN6678_c0_g1~~TRINITY_DN6678_c0_g1_i2.p1  ORF type:complete len:149 (+),score=15.52 TRINITY_DN6678_c0_g1_i2:208-654(+)
MASSGILLHSAVPEVSMRSIKSRCASFNDVSSMENIQVFLATGRGGDQSELLPLQVHNFDTIASVKMRIQGMNKGFYARNQRVFAGRELCRDDCLVKDYGVLSGQMMHLVLRLSDLYSISVKTSAGKVSLHTPSITADKFWHWWHFWR